MALSYVSYVAPGAVTDFTITFDYIAQSYVKVYLDGVLQTLTTDYTYFNATTIRFNVAPTASEVVRLERETENTVRLVDFQDAGNLTEADLDLSALQSFHMAQESIDDFTDLSLKLTGVLTWDAQSHRIVNVADPTGDQDAATKKYVDDENTTQTAAIDAAVAATAADVVSTNADVVSTNADVVSTNADVVTVAGIYDDFDDRYLGSKASAPTLDNDGNALAEGALYWNSTSKDMWVYNGTGWVDINQAVSNMVSFTATASQTTFTGGGLAYDPGTLMVWQNGIKLDAADFTATDGTSMVLDTPAVVGDIINTVGRDTFVVADAYTKTELDTGQLDSRYYTETEVDAETVPYRTEFRGPLAADLVVTNLSWANISGFAFTSVPPGVYELTLDLRRQVGTDGSLGRSHFVRFLSTGTYAVMDNRDASEPGYDADPNDTWEVSGTFGQDVIDREGTYSSNEIRVWRFEVTATSSFTLQTYTDVLPIVANTTRIFADMWAKLERIDEG
jgi:hypothetical protein